MSTTTTIFYWFTWLNFAQRCTSSFASVLGLRSSYLIALKHKSPPCFRSSHLPFPSHVCNVVILTRLNSLFLSTYSHRFILGHGSHSLTPMSVVLTTSSHLTPIWLPSIPTPKTRNIAPQRITSIIFALRIFSSNLRPIFLLYNLCISQSKTFVAASLFLSIPWLFLLWVVTASPKHVNSMFSWL